MAKQKSKSGPEIAIAKSIDSAAPKGKADKKGFIDVGKNSVFDTKRQAFVGKDHLRRLGQ